MTTSKRDRRGRSICTLASCKDGVAKQQPQNKSLVGVSCLLLDYRPSSQFLRLCLCAISVWYCSRGITSVDQRRRSSLDLASLLLQSTDVDVDQEILGISSTFWSSSLVCCRMTSRPVSNSDYTLSPSLNKSKARSHHTSTHNHHLNHNHNLKASWYLCFPQIDAKSSWISRSFYRGKPQSL